MKFDDEEEDEEEGGRGGGGGGGVGAMTGTGAAPNPPLLSKAVSYHSFSRVFRPKELSTIASDCVLIRLFSG